MARNVFRYDMRYYEPGDIMLPDTDHIVRLTGAQKDTERALRAAHPNGAAIRSQSLYGWADRAVGREMWRAKQTHYFYELEVLEADIVFESDINYFTAVTEGIAAQARLDDLVQQYWSDGTHKVGTNDRPKREVLFKQGKVISRDYGSAINALTHLDNIEARRSLIDAASDSRHVPGSLDPR